MNYRESLNQNKKRRKRKEEKRKKRKKNKEKQKKENREKRKGEQRKKEKKRRTKLFLCSFLVSFISCSFFAFLFSFNLRKEFELERQGRIMHQRMYQQ